MAALIFSTIAFFVAGYFIKRRLTEMDIPAGMTRNILVFTLALAVSYGVAVVVGRLFP